MSMTAPMPSGNDAWRAQLATMTFAQKRELFDMIWEDLAQSPDKVESPSWHRAIVEGRLKMQDEGTAEIEDWDDVERELVKLDS